MLAVALTLMLFDTAADLTIADQLFLDERISLTWFTLKGSAEQHADSLYFMQPLKCGQLAVRPRV